MQITNNFGSYNTLGYNSWNNFHPQQLNSQIDKIKIIVRIHIVLMIVKISISKYSIRQS